jgi:hypothetical protein
MEEACRANRTHGKKYIRTMMETSRKINNVNVDFKGMRWENVD